MMKTRTPAPVAPDNADLPPEEWQCDLVLDPDEEKPQSKRKAKDEAEESARPNALEDSDMTAIFGAGGRIALLLEGYEARPSQIAMAEAVRDAILTGRHALIEAPTGTGKSMAYLLPAILSGKTVVIATANKSLQSQLFFKDIPFISQVIGREVEAVIVKGRSNYLCTLKWEEELAEQKQFAFYDRENIQITEMRRWVDQTTTGDVDELPFVIEGDLRPRVVSFADDCLQQMCPHFHDGCWVNFMRDAAAQAQVIVTNHHLLLNALQFGVAGERILPQAAIYVVDEAHGLEGTATAVYETVLTDNTVDQTLNRNILKEIADEDELEALRFHSTLAFQEVQLLASDNSFPIEGELEEMRKLGRALGELHLRLKKEYPTIEAGEEFDNDEEGKRRKAIDLALELLSSTAAKVSKIAMPRKDGSEVRYGVRVFDRKRVSLELHSAPLDPASYLREFLFAPERKDEALTRTVICTSATLATGGSFVHFKARCGIQTPTIERILTPVFDYPQQALLYQPALPAFQHGNSRGYYDAVAGELDRLLEVSRGRALCLFTNWSGLQQVHERIKQGDRALIWQVRAQGDAPRDALLRWFRETRHSVLLATRSFWEGVDIPGDDLSLVVLDKLPFPTPGDPLHAARMKEIDEDGRSSFGDYMVPLMTLTLKQGFGRLIRRASDRGVVAILDERLTSKGYGRNTRNDLPPARFTREFRDVHRFFQQALASEAEFGVNLWAWLDEDFRPKRTRWRWQLVRLSDGKASAEEGIFGPPNSAQSGAESAEPDLAGAEMVALKGALTELEKRVTAGKRTPAEFAIEVRASQPAIMLLESDSAMNALLACWKAAERVAI